MFKLNLLLFVSFKTVLSACISFARHEHRIYIHEFWEKKKCVAQRDKHKQGEEEEERGISVMRVIVARSQVLSDTEMSN